MGGICHDSDRLKQLAAERRLAADPILAAERRLPAERTWAVP
jgi:hypothetical protein